MKKRKKKRKLKVGRLIFVLIVLVLIGVLIYGIICRITNTSLPSIGEKIENIVKEEEKEKTYELSMIMVGDNLIHSSVYNDASKNANYDGYDFKPMYTYIKDIVSNYDLAYYNQETILGGTELGLSDYPCFNSPYEVGDAMIDAGFNIVSLATNHTLDSGTKAILNSCEYWNSKENVLTAGSYCSTEERNELRIMESNNITYTMLNYTYGTNGIPVPSGKDYLVNIWPEDSWEEYEAYKETVKEDIKRVRDKVDVLIVAMHWGVEYTHTPTEYELDAAQFLADLGVDIIIGTHPHVVQPVTWIDDTLVIYSLGNFISAQETNLDYAKMVGLMTSLNITKTVKGTESSIKIDDVNNELLFTYYSGWRNFKVVPFSSPDISNYIWDYQRLYNKYSAVIKNMDETMSVNALSEE